MNEQETIEELIETSKFFWGEITEPFQMAIDALEKQIPKEPITYKGTNGADCPCCGARVRGIKEPWGNWCSKCGQKLDWSE